VAYTTSVERTNAVKQLGLNYRIPLYKLGGVVGLSYTNSDVVGNFGAFTSTGSGKTYGLNYSHYLQPEGGRRAFVTVGLDEKIFDTSVKNGVSLAVGQPDKISSRPLSLGYNVRQESDDAVSGYNIELAFNVLGGGGNNLQDYQNANAGPLTPDLRITSANWTALRGGANYLAPFGNGWLWSARGQFQLSSTALISGEQFGLGGVSSVRGTADRITGDIGLAGTLEVNTPELMSGLRLLGFLDAGWLRNKNTNLSPGKPFDDQLASAGFGFRYAAGVVSLSAEWGRVITAPAIESKTTSSPQLGNEMLHVNLTARF
jgi:hemolysin activation/secretion protein